jgi:hypothetical protein
VVADGHDRICVTQLSLYRAYVHLRQPFALHLEDEAMSAAPASECLAPRPVVHDVDDIGPRPPQTRRDSPSVFRKLLRVPCDVEPRGPARVRGYDAREEIVELRLDLFDGERIAVRCVVLRPTLHLERHLGV